MSFTPVTIEVVQGDVLEFAADVLALKYAQHFFGSDQAVSTVLMNKKVIRSLAAVSPLPGKCVWVDSHGAVPSPHVLFVGVATIIEFGYAGIENWARQVLEITTRDCSDARHIAVTLHGPGYGLDEIEALHAEVRGILAAVQSGRAPAHLDRVSIVERNSARLTRLQSALERLVPAPSAPPTTPARKKAKPKKISRQYPPRTGTHGPGAPPPEEADFDVALQSDITVGPPIKLRIPPLARATGGEDLTVTSPVSAKLQSTAQVERKPRVFVAMPFAPEMEDVFYYGIQNPVRQLGYICERVDQEAFTGDILDQVKMRIENAEIVIADLTSSNPNVYLEVGYAWGKGRPTVLVANKKDDLKFDVRGQRCLKYQTIKDLEKLLTTELAGLGNRQKK